MYECTLRLNKRALAWSAEDGEVVALDLSDAHYLAVNRSGAMLWDRLAVGTTKTQLVELLEQQYGLENGQAVSDVDAFLGTCRERGYLEQ